MVSKSFDHGRNRCGLMGSCLPPRQPRGRSSNLNRPLDFFRQEMTTQDQTHRLLLTVKRPTSRGPNVVRRGHQESVGKLRPVGFGQERVDFSLRDRSVRMIRLGLNGPQLPRARSGDDVDSRIGPPPIRPILPQPDLVELTSIPRSVQQEPLAEPLEVAAKCRALGITADLRFDVLEAAFRHTRLGCGRHWHLWNHRSEASGTVAATEKPASGLNRHEVTGRTTLQGIR